MPDNDVDEDYSGCGEGDIAVDDTVRKWMRNAFEAELRLTRVRARKAELDGSKKRRVRLNLGDEEYYYPEEAVLPRNSRNLGHSKV